MSQIEVSVYDQTAYFTHTPDIFSGGVGTDSVKFTFDKTWNGFNTKTAVFYNDLKKSYPVILDSNNVATIPKKVINKECTLYFGVMGATENGTVKTSSILSYRIARGVISADTEVLSPSTDVWLQILANYEFALNRLADMNNTLADMDNRLAVMDTRIIESAQENKLNINLNNLNDEGNNALLSKVNMDTILNGENYFKSPYKIKCGTVTTVQSGSDDVPTATVTFDTPFSETPVVVVSAEQGSSSNYIDVVDAKAITTSGFTVVSRNTANGLTPATVHWIAMGV